MLGGSMKRIFDLIFALIGIIITLPFLLIVSILIKVSSKGPVLFKQKRVGLNGKLFSIYKFRTMEIDQKIKSSITYANDPRITKIGKFLRKWKIDELPQLFNVLRGKMSFVGPRPEVPEYVKYYNFHQLKVLSVKPGLTDLASLKYINESKFIEDQKNIDNIYINQILPDKLQINLEYINRASAFFDLIIILRTISYLFINNKY